MINYEKEYQNSRNVCGETFPEIVEFFEIYDDECATVLDSGCGQERDALFIAPKGHFVLGVIRLKPVLNKCWKKRKVKNLLLMVLLLILRIMKRLICKTS